MATFTPPFRDGQPMTSPEGTPTANRLMRFYDNWAQGVTIWKDSGGVWRESLEPYLGGATHTVHNQWNAGVGPTTTVTAADEGLATAQVVYAGGHVHTITEAEATELVAAGYGSGMLTRESISESFNKADGALGPDLAWERTVFTNDHPFTVVSNQLRVFADEAGSHEDIQVPTPNVDSPDATMSLTIANVDRTGSGDYVVDLGGVLRLETRDGNTNYRGYACAVGRNNTFVPPIDLWHLLLFRIDSTSGVTLLDSAFLGLAAVTLPGTFTFTADGSAISASFAHGGGGGTMTVDVVDSTYADGLLAIGGSAVIDAGETATIDADSFQAGPA